MHQPPGFKDPQHLNHVCLLKKAIYGLKQAPRQWFTIFTTYLLHIGFQPSTSDPSLFLYHHKQDHVYLLLYVDDILLTGNSPTAISNILQHLQTQFNTKVLSPVNHFLGIQVLTDPHGLLLSQASYAESILQKAGMNSCNPVQNPLPLKPPDPQTNTSTITDPHLYRQLVGALQYLTIARPDLQFPTNLLCQHLHKPTTIHFLLLKRLLRYVRGTVHFALPIRPGNLQLHSYADASWASDNQDRRSTTGFCSFLGNTLISWQVKKQPTVARSSTEAEYRSLASTAADITWLRRILAEFQIPTSDPTPLYCDNISALALANNPVFHARIKHIEIDYHFIREKIHNKEIQVLHIATQDQPADILTKALSTNKFKQLCHKLTLQEVPINLRGDKGQLSTTVQTKQPIQPPQPKQRIKS